MSDGSVRDGGLSMTEQIQSYGVVPVIVLSDPAQGAPLADALARGGLPVAEVTLRSDAAIEGMRAIAKDQPDVLLGAGTVTSVEQVKASVDVGARFIVTPGFNPVVVDYCLTRSLPVFPGISGTGEIEQALSRGLEVVKLFPAEALGGVAMIKALSGPYRTLRFMPTGGVNLGNLHSYLALPQVVACGGSWLVPGEKLAAGDFDAIAENVRSTMRSILGLTIDDGLVEIDARYPARTRAYLQRVGVTAADGPNGIEIGAKSVILRG